MSNSSPTPVLFRVIADYQLLGEDDNGGIIDAEAWFSELMEYAEVNTNIESGALLHVEGGYWGLQYIVFTVDILTPMCSTPKELKKTITKDLNALFNDSDVHVRWINRRVVNTML